MKDLMVMARIAGRQCAINAHDVQSVIELGAVTPVPGTPEHIAGITALRSQTLTVIDCRLALGFDPGRFELDHRAIVANVRGHPYALKVDAIEDITMGVEEATEISGGFGSEWSHVAVGLLETAIGPALMLDLDKLIEVSVDLGEAA